MGHLRQPFASPLNATLLRNEFSWVRYPTSAWHVKIVKKSTKIPEHSDEHDWNISFFSHLTLYISLEFNLTSLSAIWHYVGTSKVNLSNVVREFTNITAFNRCLSRPLLTALMEQMLPRSRHLLNLKKSQTSKFHMPISGLKITNF